MPEAALNGAEFKKQLRAGTPKMGLFLNAHSPTLAEQLAHSGYDWLLVDTQHGPMGYEKLSAMLSAVANSGPKSMGRVGGGSDRPGNQQHPRPGGGRGFFSSTKFPPEAGEAGRCTKNSHPSKRP